MDVNELVDRATELLVQVREQNALAPTQAVARRQAEALREAGFLHDPSFIPPTTAHEGIGAPGWLPLDDPAS